MNEEMEKIQKEREWRREALYLAIMGKSVAKLEAAKEYYKFIVGGAEKKANEYPPRKS